MDSSLVSHMSCLQWVLSKKMVSLVFWGAAIIFFLASFINFHNANTQGFWVEVSSQVENALFTLTGIGLIPVRAIDTYRECINHLPHAIC
jgi:hypothetical protein